MHPIILRKKRFLINKTFPACSIYHTTFVFLHTTYHCTFITMAIPQNYDFAQFNDIEYHIAQRERYRLSLLDISRNMGIADDVLEDTIEADFENMAPALRQYGAMIELHTRIYDLLSFIRDLHGGNDNHEAFYEAIRACINRFYADLPRVSVEMTENWMNTRRNPANV